MRAIMKLKPESGLWMSDQPVPEIGPAELLIRIHRTAICGSDLHIYAWDELAGANVPLPMIIGHEYAGEVIEVGKVVTNFKAGDRVTGEGHLVCGQCKTCQTENQHLCSHAKGVGSTFPGAFADYLRLPASNAVKLPDDISDEHGSLLDALGNAVHAVSMFEIAGRDVLVTGAGPIGIMAAAVAQRIGARSVVLTDLNPYRLQLARRLGVERVVNLREQSMADAMADAGVNEGFDVGLEMSGAAPAFNDQLVHVAPGGGVALFGLTARATIDFPMNASVIKGLTLKGVYGRRMFETWREMIAMIQSGLDITGIITHRLAPEDFDDGFKAMQSGQAGKVVLQWN